MPLDPDNFDGRTPLCDWCCERAEHLIAIAGTKSLLLCAPCYKDWQNGATGDELGPLPGVNGLTREGLARG